jgi:hypothetical protein
LLTIIDYESSDKLAEFDAYSQQRTPRVFLGLLESRANINQLSEEIRDEIIDIVQECRRFIYQQYRQDAIQKAPAATDSIAPLGSPHLHLPSCSSRSNIGNENTNSNSNENSSSNGNGNGKSNPKQPTLFLEDAIDLFDPDEFQRIFEDNGMLYSDDFVFDHIDLN